MKNMFDEDFIRMTMALFCEGIILMNNNFEQEDYSIPVPLENAFDNLKAISIIENEEISTHLQDIYNLISKPINSWGINFIDRSLKEEEKKWIIYNKKYKFNREYSEGILTGAYILRESLATDDIKEYFELSKPFYKLRNNLSQKEYECFRTFMQGDSLFDSNYLDEQLFNINSVANEKIIREKFIKPLDESLIYGNVVYCCKECGFPMRKNNLGELFCSFDKCVAKKEVLDISLDSNIQITISENKKYYTLSEYAQRYMKIPGISERDLIEKLNQIQSKESLLSEISIFPNKDMADLRVLLNSSKDDKVYHILDVKDYLDPKKLAKIIAQEYNLISSKISKLSISPSSDNIENEFYIIIPDYLLKKEEKYKQIFEKTLKEKVKNSNITLLSIDNYIKKIKKDIKKYKKNFKEDVYQYSLFEEVE